MNRNDLISSTGHLGLPNTTGGGMVAGSSYQNVWRLHGYNHAAAAAATLQEDEEEASPWRLAPPYYGDQELIGRDIVVVVRDMDDLDSPNPFHHHHRSPGKSFHQIMSTLQSNDNTSGVLSRKNNNNNNNNTRHPPKETTTTMIRPGGRKKEVNSCSSSSRSGRQQEWINNLPWIRKSMEFADKARESE